MAQGLPSPEANAVVTASSPPVATRAFRVGIWLFRRFVCCVGKMFLTFIAVILIAEWYKP